MEKIIKFPLPEHRNFFDDLSSLNYSPFCLCYQYSIENNYGPYGFNTDIAKLFLNDIFLNGVSWSLKYEKLINKISLSPDNICFYDTNISLLQKEVINYKLQTLKNRLTSKLADEPRKVIEKPCLYEIFNDEKRVYSTGKINELIGNDYSLFLNVFFTPEAGSSLIVFDNEILSEIRDFCVRNTITYQEEESIDRLNPW